MDSTQPLTVAWLAGVIDASNDRGRGRRRAFQRRGAPEQLVSA
jgi:hypothetical protein